MCLFRTAVPAEGQSDETEVAVPMSVSLFPPTEKCRVERISPVHPVNARSLTQARPAGDGSVRNYFLGPLLGAWLGQPTPAFPSPEFAFLFENTVLSLWQAQCVSPLKRGKEARSLA